MTISIWTSYCQKKLKNKDWHSWLFESVHGGLLLTGAVCPIITKGANKGKPNFRKRDKNTITKVFIPKKDL